MKRREEATRGGVTLAAILWLLSPTAMWAGTFEAPAIVPADETGAFSFEVIYTPGPRECFDYESVMNVSNTDVVGFNGDGFCMILLDECVPFSVGPEGSISGSLLDPTAVGIVAIDFSTACSDPCVTPTPPPPATPASTPTPVAACPTDPGGYFSAEVQIVPFSSATCRDNGDCTSEDFCETEPGRCGEIGLCTARPEICPDVFDPVCGCDGYSYANSCYAARVGAPVDHLGECEPPTPTPTPTPLPPLVGDIPMCKIKDNSVEKTRMVPPRKVQRLLDKGFFTRGECRNPTNGRVLCKTKRGKRVNVLLPDRKVQRALDKGFFTRGECGTL